MKNTQSNMKEKEENAKGIFRKMIADKRAVHSYIRKHGTLEGFEDGAIVFAKPL